MAADSRSYPVLKPGANECKQPYLGLSLGRREESNPAKLHLLSHTSAPKHQGCTATGPTLSSPQESSGVLDCLSIPS